MDIVESNFDEFLSKFKSQLETVYSPLMKD